MYRLQKYNCFWKKFHLSCSPLNLISKEINLTFLRFLLGFWEKISKSLREAINKKSAYFEYLSKKGRGGRGRSHRKSQIIKFLRFGTRVGSRAKDITLFLRLYRWNQVQTKSRLLEVTNFLLDYLDCLEIFKIYKFLFAANF